MTPSSRASSTRAVSPTWCQIRFRSPSAPTESGHPGLIPATRPTQRLLFARLYIRMKLRARSTLDPKSSEDSTAPEVPVSCEQVQDGRAGVHAMDRAGPCQRLPETAPRVTSRRPTARSSAPPFTWAVVRSREVLTGGVNPRRIDGKDGVAGSIPAGGSTPRLTSANAGESPSGTVAADPTRSGMGCKGSARRGSANSPAEQQLWSWGIRYGSSLGWSHGGNSAPYWSLGPAGGFARLIDRRGHVLGALRSRRLGGRVPGT